MSKAALISTGYRISWGLSELLRHALTVRRKIAATRNHHIRLSHTGSPMALPHPQFSAGTVPDTAKATLAPLLKSGGGRWTLTADGEGLERTFKFAGFAKTWVCFGADPGWHHICEICLSKIHVYFSRYSLSYHCLLAAHPTLPSVPYLAPILPACSPNHSPLIALTRSQTRGS